MASPLADNTELVNVNKRTLDDLSPCKQPLKARKRLSLVQEQKHLPTDYQAFIHASRYARWMPEKHRRETWTETVSRYFDYMTTHLQKTYNFKLTSELRQELEPAVVNLEVMPSMRALMTAGDALDRCHVAGYNCSYLPVDHPYAFDEVLFILMNGTGVGFSVEKQYVSQLPTVPEKLEDTDEVVQVEDSREGWSLSLRKIIDFLYEGKIVSWNTDNIRPAGARLKTFGGRASGPGPLIELFKFVVRLFKNAKGRKLSSLECHDLVCKVAEVVVVGGVRRSALISLSDLDDKEMRDAKQGNWWKDQPQRAMANNSAVYDERPSMDVFMEEWNALYKSKSGERGIFSRIAAKKQVAKLGRRDAEFEFGTNPCSEIILRPYQFCNLTEVVVRSEDTVQKLEKKVELATILGTIQASLTKFPYLRDVWQQTTEEERLLGVSLTGVLDNKLMSGKNTSLANGNITTDRSTRSVQEDILNKLREKAVAVNKDFSSQIGVSQSKAVTCVKPSGTVSQLVDAASGIHPRHSEYYIRRVRCNKDDPLKAFLQKSGVPVEDCEWSNGNTSVFSFPIKSPEGALTRDDLTAIDQLQLCLLYQRHWCEHKPSVTVTVREHEWMTVGAWVYEHFEEMAGVSFLPYDGGSYKQMPYEKVEKEEYEKLLAKMPLQIDWMELERREDEDKCEFELACSAAGGCEMVDVP